MDLSLYPTPLPLSHSSLSHSDLRRGFGTRWVSRVKPATLKLLMRHADVTTTMRYYVTQDAAEVADELWAGFGGDGNTFGNSVHPTGEKREKAPAERSTEAFWQ